MRTAAIAWFSHRVSWVRARRAAMWLLLATLLGRTLTTDVNPPKPPKYACEVRHARGPAKLLQKQFATLRKTNEEY